ncbi:MAG: hypothetical protein SO072_07910 [Dysosmobacter sp.]|nr:hypothetical protein [Dysosmobacter sp.]
MKNRAKSLKRAVVDSLKAILRIGTSKKKARDEENRKAREKARAAGKSEKEIKEMPWLPSPFIHSIGTYYQYRAICWKYVEWLAENHPDVQKLHYALRQGYAREYVQLMIERGLAPSTIARTTSALAKLYRCRAYEIHNARPERRYAEFTRCRGYSEDDYAKDLEKYGVIVEVCRMIGVRRVELRHIYPECFREDAYGKLYVHLDGRAQHCKGGRSRDVVILDCNQQRMREILKGFVPGKLMFPKVPSHLNVHAIRAFYAMDYYDAIARPVEEIPLGERVPLKHPKTDKRRPNQVRDTAPAIYQRRSDGRQFDRKSLLIVTESLGHDRESVIVQNYYR